MYTYLLSQYLKSFISISCLVSGLQLFLYCKFDSQVKLFFKKATKRIAKNYKINFSRNILQRVKTVKYIDLICTIEPRESHF